MKYRLLHGASPTEMNQLVNEFIILGWKLYGSPYAIEKNHFQVITKSEPGDENRSVER
jgi:hypothetical protein